MEEARQHPSLISDRVGALLFILVVGELLSIACILVLAFTARDRVFLALHFFGAFLALRMAALSIHGLVSGMHPSPGRNIERIQQPIKFWLYELLYLFGFVVGVFVMLVPFE